MHVRIELDLINERSRDLHRIKVPLNTILDNLSDLLHMDIIKEAISCQNDHVSFSQGCSIQVCIQDRVCVGLEEQRSV